MRDSRLRILADDLIQLKSTADAEIADETSLRARRDGVDRELNEARLREEELDRIASIENPLLTKAQENYYQLNSQREKFRGMQNLASERARFLSEEIEEARASGRDPVALDGEAKALREEELGIRTEVSTANTALTATTEDLKNLEARLTAEENLVSAALRAIADQREGTARQEGHINGLRSRIDATDSEISRLTKAKDEANTRWQKFKEEFAMLETQIASLDAGETGLDGEFESAKNKLNSAQGELKSLQEKEVLAAKSKATLEGRLRALQESLIQKDGSATVLSSGIRSRGKIGRAHV